MQVTVAFSGQITDTLVERSSGNPNLDRRAQAIAKAAGPFGTVPDKVQAKLLKTGYNRLAFIQTFTFARDGTLETRLVRPMTTWTFTASWATRWNTASRRGSTRVSRSSPART